MSVQSEEEEECLDFVLLSDRVLDGGGKGDARGDVCTRKPQSTVS